MCSFYFKTVEYGGEDKGRMSQQRTQLDCSLSSVILWCVLHQHQQQEMIFKESDPEKLWDPASDKRSVFFLWVKLKLTVEYNVKHRMLRRESLLYTWTENSMRFQATASQPLIGAFPWRYSCSCLGCAIQNLPMWQSKVFCVNVKRTRYSTGFCRNKLLGNMLQCL